MPTRASVFDSWALLAYFQNEPSAAQVETLLNSAHANLGPLLMTAVNLGEVWYSVARARTPAVADVTVQNIIRLKFEIIEADWPLAHQAAIFKAKHRVSYADCFAAALAKRADAVLITGDREFKAMVDEISIYWV